MTFPKFVKMVEVGPRDGLQNESQIVPTDIKVTFINHLSDTGLKNIEATSFVSSKHIPQMADNKIVMKEIKKTPGVTYSALVPNLKGLVSAIECNIKEIAVFAAASETFSQKNINCSIEESLKRYDEVTKEAKKHNIRVRGYVSCALGCPYEGDVKPAKVADVARQLWNLGCYEISLGDTIGKGTPKKAKQLIEIVVRDVPIEHVAVHFHDTYGQALANIYAVLELGIGIIDSSVAGLGGCPYAPGATGNVASEDVLYLLNGLNIETGVNLNSLCKAGEFISYYLKRPSRSKVANALFPSQLQENT